MPAVKLLPWPEPPTVVEIEYQLGDDFERDEAPDADSSEVLWVEALRLPEFRLPVLIWACAIDELPDTVDLGDVHWDDGEREKADTCKWLLGIETFLDPNSPIASYQRQLHLCRDSEQPVHRAVRRELRKPTDHRASVSS